MHEHDTIKQALQLLVDRGDHALRILNDKKMQPRPSAVLKAMNSYRSQALFVHDDADDEDDMLELLPTTVSAEDEALGRLPDDYTELQDALGELTAKQREVIHSVYWQGLDLRQTSDRLKCSYENARLHHSKAIKRLRTRLHDHAA